LFTQAIKLWHPKIFVIVDFESKAKNYQIQNCLKEAKYLETLIAKVKR